MHDEKQFNLVTTEQKLMYDIRALLISIDKKLSKDSEPIDVKPEKKGVEILKKGGKK